MRRSLAGLVSVLSVISLGLLSGCGGSDDSDNGGGLVSNAKFTIAWPARSRNLQAPASALSFRFVMNDAGAGDADVVLAADRPAGTTASTNTYTLPQGIQEDSGSFTITFFAGAGQSGAVVGTASAAADLDGDDLVIGAVALEGTVAEVTVANATTSLGDPPLQLIFSAEDANQNSLAVSPGSAHWRIEDGGTHATLTEDGLATGLSAGVAHVIAKVDGIDSNAAALTVIDQEAVITASAIKPASNLTESVQVIGDTALFKSAANFFIYDFATDSLTEYSGGRTSPDKTDYTANFTDSGDGQLHAGLRTNGPTSAVIDLHPAGMLSSRAVDLNDTTQVGVVNVDAVVQHAARWSGTKDTFVDLHPAGAHSSDALSIFGDIAGGAGYYPGSDERRALLWNGTTMIDAHPTGWMASAIGKVGRKYASGSVIDAGQNHWAATWAIDGTGFQVLDAVDLGANVQELGREPLTEDYAVGLKDNAQGTNIAVIWNVATKKFINLDAHSPFGPDHGSFARSFTALPNGSGVRVIGVARDGGGVLHAVVWTVPLSALTAIND